jgi:hypothetical protein
MKKNKILQEICTDWKYYFLLSIIIAFATWFNYDSNLMSGILPYYRDFSSFITNGFEYKEPFTSNIYTWPMWGYGFMLLLGSKFLIISLQQILTLLTILLLRIEFREILSKKAFDFMSRLIWFALPWFLFHVSLWPYSLSANLLTIGVCFLGIGLDKYNKYFIYASSLLLGIALNFRSDYFYLVWAIFIIVLSISIYRKNWFQIKHVSIWISIVILFLLPWFFYTKMYSGTGKFVSSNSGHVFFISLGQLPNNKWKITTSDGDSVMYDIINSNFGKKESSLTIRSSEVLMEEFKVRVSNDPMEFLTKCVFNLKSVIIMPFYVGDHSNSFNAINIGLIKELIEKRDLIQIVRIIFHSINGFLLFQLIVYFVGLYVFFLLVWTLIKFRNIKLGKSHFLFLELLVFTTIFYQFALNIFAYNLPIYFTNIYILCIVFISLVRSRLELNKVLLSSTK